MNKQELVEGLLFAGFRLMATVFIIMGLLGFIIQVADSWYRFDPNYLGAWIAGTLLRPVLTALAGLFLYGVAAPLSRCMAARFAPDKA